MNSEHLREKARMIRLLILDIICKARMPHIGSAFSCVDILTYLYFNEMSVDPQNPLWPDRDRFILSKGHACAALYSTLSLAGFFQKDKLSIYGENGSNISGHATLGSLPGIEATSGSGGHGLSIGVGMALAGQNLKKSFRVFILCGDGEMQEGSIYEAAMFAGMHKLKNICMIVDRNGLQIMGKVSEIIDIDPLGAKFESFKWETREMDGHDFISMSSAFKGPQDKPKLIIANTIKGKGVSFMENRAEWHGKCPNEIEYFQAKKELEEL